MLKCCDKLEDEVGYYTLKKEEDGTFTCTGVNNRSISGIKFCPFCGTSLAPRFVVEKSQVLDWLVRDTLLGSVVAHFYDPIEAQYHAERLNDNTRNS